MLSLQTLEMASDSVSIIEREREAREGRTAYIYGQVLDNDGGRPMVNVSTQIVGTNQGVPTSGNGRFVLRDVDPGEVRIRFEFLSYATREVRVDLQPGMAYEVTVRMDPDPLDIVLEHLTSLHGTWKRAVTNTGGE